MVAHEPLVADHRAVVVLRLRAGRSGVKGQGGPVMGDGLGGPHPPPPVVVLVDDEGPAAAGGVHEAAGQTHVGEVALGEGAGPLGGPLAVPDVVLPPGPQLPRQEAALVVGLQVVLVIPLGQQQSRPEAPAELDEDLVEGLLPLQRRPLGEEQFQAGLQLIRATGIGAQHVGHLLQVGHAEEPLDLLLPQPCAQVGPRVLPAPVAVAEGLVVVGGVESVQAGLDALADHGLENRQPPGIAHAAAVGAVGASLDGAPSQGSVGIALGDLLDALTGRRAEEVVRPHALPGLAEEPPALLVVAEVHGRGQLADDAGAGLLDAGNDLGGPVQVGPDTAQGHAHPRRLDTLVLGEGVELHPEVPHLHELDPGPAHVGDDLGRLGQRPVLDDAADAARLVH